MRQLLTKDLSIVQPITLHHLLTRSRRVHLCFRLAFYADCWECPSASLQNASPVSDRESVYSEVTPGRHRAESSKGWFQIHFPNATIDCILYYYNIYYKIITSIISIPNSRLLIWTGEINYSIYMAHFKQQVKTQCAGLGYFLLWSLYIKWLDK